MSESNMSESNMTESNVLALHQSLVSIPSLSHEETDAANFLEDVLRKAGLQVRRIEDNIVAEFGSTHGPVLMLNSHLDVVPPSSDHPFPPFEATLKDGKVYGRGAVDAKASVAAMCTAMMDLFRSGFHPEGKVQGVFTVCEETGGQDNGLERVLQEIPLPDAVLVGEPTFMQPCVAQKGLLILRLDAKGKTAHAARAGYGDNAISRMVRDIAKLEAHSFERVHDYLGETTANVTVIEGGSARNVIPDLCSCFVDIRSTPSYTHDEIAESLNQMLESEVHIHSKRFVPTDTDPSSQIVQACLSASPGATAFGSPTMSDWIHLKDIPAVKIGPGDSTLSHTAAEHVEVEELQRGAAIYKNIITSFFRKSDV